MYEPENQSLIGSLIQKTWGENQGHLTPHVFQKKSLSSITFRHFIHFIHHLIHLITLTPPHFFPSIHPFITFHSINKVIFFRQLKLFCAAGGYHCSFRSCLAILQPFNHSVALCTCIKKNTVCLKRNLQFRSHQQ